MKPKSINKIAEGAGFVLFGLILTKLFGYFYRVIVARIGVEEYGLISLALAITGFLTAISFLGVNYGIVRYTSYYKEKNEYHKVKGVLRSALKICLPLSILLALLLFIFSDFISVNLFHNINLSIILKWMAIIIVLEILRRIFLNVIKGFEIIKYDVITRNFIGDTSRFLLTLTLVLLGYGLMGAVWGHILSLAISTIFSYYFLKKKIYPLFKDSKYSDETKELINYSWPLLFIDLLALILLWTDTFMLGYFKDASAVGLYNTAGPTAQLILVIPTALITMFLPVLTGLYAKNDMKLFGDIYKRTNKWILIVNLVILISFVFFSGSLLGFIFGSEYNGAGIVLAILGFAFFMNALTLSSQNVLMIIKKTKFLFWNSLIGGLLNIILNIFLIPKYGLIGAAISTTISLTVISILLWIWAYYNTKINPFSIDYIKVLVSGLLTYVLIIFISKFVNFNKSFYMLLIGLFVICLIYLVFLLLTRSLDKEDWLVIDDLKRKFLIK